MLSLVSDRKISMTSWESTPSSRARARRSRCANPILSPWNVLSTYFVISATGGSTRNSGAVEAGVEAETASPLARVELADHGLGRVVEVLDARALAEELGVHRDAEVGAGDEARGLLEQRHQDAQARAGQHRRAEDHGVAARASSRVASAPPISCAARCEVGGVEAAVGRRGRADAHEREVGAVDRGGDVVGDRQPPGGDDLGDDARRCAPRPRACDPRRSSRAWPG